MGGIGAAAGPLIGGLIDRDQLAGRVRVPGARRRRDRAPEPKLADPLPADPTRPFDGIGAVLSAVGMFFVVFGILQAGTNNTLFFGFLAIGAAFLAGFFLYIRRRERAGKEALLSTGAVSEPHLQPRLGDQEHPVAPSHGHLVRRLRVPAGGTWLQRDPDGRRFHRRDGRHPPLVFRPAAAREAVRAAKLIIAGFVVTLADIALLLGFVHTSSRVVAFVPGLLLIGLGVGAMLTPSVNVVQSSFPEALQGEISGLSRAISNLGSSFGTAIAGTILVSVVALGFRSYAVALIVLIGIGLLGLVAALRLPAKIERA